MYTYNSLVASARATLKAELRDIRERAAAARRAIGKRAATAGPDLVAEGEEMEARRRWNEACKDAAAADPDGFAVHQLAKFGHDPRPPMTAADMAGCD